MLVDTQGKVQIQLGGVNVSIERPDLLAERQDDMTDQPKALDLLTFLIIPALRAAGYSENTVYDALTRAGNGEL